MLIWSDAFLHYVVSIQRPEWHADLDDEKAQAVETRKRLLNMAADHRLLVAGYHMPFPGLGHIESVNGRFRWLPVSYQLQRLEQFQEKCERFSVRNCVKTKS